MIDNPENGHKPDMGDTEVKPGQDIQTATAVAEPDAQAAQTRMTEREPTQEAAGDSSAAVAEPLPATTEPLGAMDFSSELTKFRSSFEEIQAEFLGEPRAAVGKAETLIDSLMTGLRDHLQRIHGSITTETDTEQLRVAMLSYRDLFDSLGGHRAA